MPKDEKLESIKNKLEKSKEEMIEEKETELSAETSDQPIKGRWLVWSLLFGMVFSFIAAFISIILRSHGII